MQECYWRPLSQMLSNCLFTENVTISAAHLLINVCSVSAKQVLVQDVTIKKKKVRYWNKCININLAADTIVRDCFFSFSFFLSKHFLTNQNQEIKSIVVGIEFM